MLMGLNWTLTFHDGYVYGSPAGARDTAQPWPMCDGWTASAGHQASPVTTYTYSTASTPPFIILQYVLQLQTSVSLTGHACTHVTPSEEHDPVLAIIRLSPHSCIPMYFWRFPFNFCTLLHYLFGYSSTEIKQKRITKTCPVLSLLV